MQQYQQWFAVNYLTGTLVPNPTVTVYLTGTSTLATGLLNASASPISNPFTGQPNGLIGFSAPNGVYDIAITSGPYAAPLMVGVKFSNGAASQRSITSSAGLPVVASDEILNFGISAPLTVTIPAFSSRNGMPLTLNNLASSTATLTWIMTSPDEASGETTGTLAPSAGMTLVPAADGVNSGYSIE
jgi:hypothetical protein